MPDQTSPNPTGQRGHHETNEVAAEGPAVISQTAATSAGGGGTESRGGQSDTDTAGGDGQGRAGPLMKAPTAGEPARSILAEGSPNNGPNPKRD